MDNVLFMIAGFLYAGVLTEERFSGLVSSSCNHGSSLAAGDDLNIKVWTWYGHRLVFSAPLVVMG